MRRPLFLAACSALVLVSVPAGVLGQGETFFKRSTSPQVVAGGDFTTDIVLLNTAATTCNFGIVAHVGAGQPSPEVVIGGQPGGFVTGSLPPGGAMPFSITSPTRDFVGAVTVDLLTPACFNAFSVQTQYRINSGGGLSELFSYPDPEPVKAGQCATAPVILDPDPDGGTVIPGLATVSGNPIAGGQLCHQLEDKQGEPVTNEVCEPTDGSHQAKLLTDIFDTSGFESGDVSSWRVCVDTQQPAPDLRLDVLFIDVVVEEGVTQFDSNEHQIENPQCRTNERTLCLNDGRFQVTVDFLPPAPTSGPQPGRVGGILEDDSGLYFFLDPNNVELLVKVIDGCAINDFFWVFAAATTNVEYTLRVTDTRTDDVKVFQNPLAMPFEAITDTEAFATCP